jgi:hypothetical protein
VPDLSAIFRIAGTAAGSLIATSGTTISITRPTAPGPVDPDTLTVTAPTSTPIAANVPALVLLEATAAAADAMAGQPRGVSRATVLCLPDVTAPRTGDLITVLTSLDTRLVGRTIQVAEVPDTSAGAVRRLTGYALPMAGGVQ